ncbi:MAG TPA: hypothetical protein VFZ02_13800 [Ktedonobacteraceae bacterium]
MINQPETQEQKPQSGKLVLPVPPAEEQQMYYGGQKAQLRPEQLIRRQTQSAPTGVGARLAFYWRKDPAYKVLMIAMSMVLITGIIFVSLASAAFLGNSSSLASPSSPQAIPKGANPTGTVDLRPAFPPPGGGSGSNQQDSQPPAQTTPALQPTSTDQQSPTPGGNGTLSVQFTSIPSQVVNGSYVLVGVNTSEPGASVLLVIRYSSHGGRSTAGPQITDSNGDASIPWLVSFFGFGQNSVQAYVYALATDQNGQRARSQTVTVQVLNRGVG